MLCLLLLTGCSTETQAVVTTEPPVVEIVSEVAVNEPIIDSENLAYDNFLPTTSILKEYTTNNNNIKVNLDDIEVCELLYYVEDNTTGLIRVAGIDGISYEQYSIYVIQSDSLEDVCDKVIMSHMLTDMSCLIRTMAGGNRLCPIDFSNWEWTEEHEDSYTEFCNNLVNLYNIECIEDLSLSIKNQDNSEICCDCYAIRKQFDDRKILQDFFWVMDKDDLYWLILPSFDVCEISYGAPLMIHEMSVEYLKYDNIDNLFKNVLCISMEVKDEHKLTENAYLFRDTLNNKILYEKR